VAEHLRRENWALQIARQGKTMDAIIGRYKVRMEETGLILKHPSGISFDFLPNEVLAIWNFIDFYREQLSDTRLATETRLEAIETEEFVDHNNRWRDK
jgi:hypothetical protein